MITKLTLLLFLFLLIQLTLSFEDNFFKKSLWDELSTNDKFSSFMKLVVSQNLTDTFKALSSQTVFACTNDAFSSLPNPYIVVAKTDPAQVLYHVVTASIKSDELWDGRLLNTMANKAGHVQKIRVSKPSKSMASDSELSVGNGIYQAKVTESDIITSNGVIHVIDSLLHLPASIDKTLNHLDESRDFYKVWKTANITEVLKGNEGNTLFVYEGDVFENELEQFEKDYLMKHPEGANDLKRFLLHQISPTILYSDSFTEGKSTISTIEDSENLEILVENKEGAPSKITVNGARIIKKDILYDNGVIHIVDKPLLPKNKNFFNLTARKALIGLGSGFFIDLLDKHGLGSYLDETDSPITLLAPQNETLDKISFFGKQKTESWLKYHIIHGLYEPEKLQDGDLLETESHAGLGSKLFQMMPVHVLENDEQKTISFGQSGVVGNPVLIKDKMIIYQINQQLEVPGCSLDVLSSDMRLSTYLASLYGSRAGKSINTEPGISIFAPNNEAFARLGLLAKHLLLPESRKKLDQVITYHAIRSVFYVQLAKIGDYLEATLSTGSPKISVNKTKDDGLFIRGKGARDGDDRNVIGKVIGEGILTANGVLYTIDRVQIPDSINVDNHELLTVETTRRLLDLIQKTNIADEVLHSLDHKRPYTILAPTDEAFQNFDYLGLLENRDQFIKVVKLHIIPDTLPRLNPDEVSLKKNQFKTSEDIKHTGTEFPTLLGAENKILIFKNLDGGYMIGVKDSNQETAKVVNIGRNTAGGGVIMIDRVLDPKEQPKQQPNNRWNWISILFVVLGSLIGLVCTIFLVFMCWRHYSGHPEGYISLGQN